MSEQVDSRIRTFRELLLYEATEELERIRHL